MFYGAVIPIALIVCYNIITFASAAYELYKRPGDISSEDDIPGDASVSKVKRLSQRLYAALLVCGAFTLSVILGYLHLADLQNQVLQIMFIISVVITGVSIFGLFCFYLDDVRMAILPSRFVRRYPEMDTPLSFHNVGYGEDGDVVEKRAEADTENK